MSETSAQLTNNIEDKLCNEIGELLRNDKTYRNVLQLVKKTQTRIAYKAIDAAIERIL